MKSKLTTRQQLFAKHIATGTSGTKAAVLAGYSQRSARFIASELLTNPNVTQHIEKLFEQAGLSDEQLIARLKTGIDAGLGTRASNSDALKGLRMAFELKNRFPTKVAHSEVTVEEKMRVKLQSMTYEEVALKLEEMTAKTQVFLDKLKAQKQSM